MLGLYWKEDGKGAGGYPAKGDTGEEKEVVAVDLYDFASSCACAAWDGVLVIH